MTNCTTLAVCALLDISGTHVTLGPTDHSFAYAEVWLHNEASNSASDEATHVMLYDGLSVSVTFDWERGLYGEDAIIVTPPDGYVCEPINCEAIVMETFSGVIYLVPFMGM